ncbi:MAG: hypothetical protein E4H20_08910 [Spirochaetales bacterium]|nr:MAG: hypothetical protein E4H20_08910 [Spirochaetales bacterium]
MIRILGWVALSLLPTVAIAAARFILLRADLDEKAKALFLRQARIFFATTAPFCLVLLLGAGRLALPVIPVMILSVFVLRSLVRALFRRA